MSIFTIREITELIISHTDIVYDYRILITLNKFIYDIMSVRYLGDLKLMYTDNYKYDYEMTIFETWRLSKKKFYGHSYGYFISACRYGSDLCYNLFKNHNIDHCELNNLAFRISCVFGHLNIAMWLISLCSINNICTDLSYVFGKCCSDGPNGCSRS